MGNHERLRVLHEGHSLVLAVYRHTEAFRRQEWFGLRAQMRRAAFVAGPEWTEVRNRCDLVVRQLQRLVDRMEAIAERDQTSR